MGCAKEAPAATLQLRSKVSSSLNTCACDNHSSNVFEAHRVYAPFKGRWGEGSTQVLETERAIVKRGVSEG